jgi:cell division protein FtsN
VSFGVGGAYQVTMALVRYFAQCGAFDAVRGVFREQAQIECDGFNLTIRVKSGNHDLSVLSIMTPTKMDAVLCLGQLSRLYEFSMPDAVRMVFEKQ